MNLVWINNKQPVRFNFKFFKIDNMNTTPAADKAYYIKTMAVWKTPFQLLFIFINGIPDDYPFIIVVFGMSEM